jgi:hypothetical protein
MDGILHNMSKMEFTKGSTISGRSNRGCCLSIGNVLKAKTPVTATCDSHYYTCLGHLGRHDTDRNISIDQAK